MVINFSVPVEKNTETKRHYINMSNGSTFPTVCVGRDSYIVDGEITSGVQLTISKGYAVHNLHIGQFVSIAHGVGFTMGLGHDYLNLSTGTSKLFKENNEHNYEGGYKEKGQILIQNDVWLGHDVTVMAGVTIHNGAIVAANSHVVNDVPPYAIVGGNPAKIIKYRFSEEIIEKLLTIQWWNWSDERIKENREFFKSRNIVDFCNKFYNEALENNKKIKDIEIPKKENTYLFFMDFTEQYSLWERVIKEFINNFKLKTDHLLILYIDEEFANNNMNLINLLSEFIDEQLVTENSMCSISICIENKENERSMFKKTDYFITNRSEFTILHSEYSYENNVKVISGVDIPIF
ncbi:MULTISPECIES: CatB-related O-acetyltransferase [Clostridium]|uniref:CatB-related O-acetyltransferase n=1 Tax=Clostridium cibarium TaxID=2762247 RepID=A0ABR8PWH3_9CLOT|nr:MULTISPECIES: CatB-related O-acetyltransferase [Clostridium]MBD7912510.1 CatB-related O-acetyltransferase [Clostridium cibarium]